MKKMLAEKFCLFSCLRKSMEYFNMEVINNLYYQTIVYNLPYGIVCFVYINPKLDNARLNDLVIFSSYYSMKEDFVSVIGDVLIRYGTD